MKTNALVILALIAIAAPAAAECRYERAVQARASAAGIDVIAIDAGAGSLTVVGTAGTEVNAHGRACASDDQILPDLTVEVSRRGNRLFVETRIPDDAGSWFGNWYARIDLTIEVPAGARVEIEDGSGATSVRGVAALDIDDGSGEIDVRDIRGEVRIDDGSGSISVREAGGPVRIEDGSGSIEIRAIRGDVIIEEDGSGSMDIFEITGSVTVERDGSGSIAVRDVGGNFHVARDGSGSIQVDDVRGRVSIPRD